MKKILLQNIILSLCLLCFLGCSDYKRDKEFIRLETRKWIESVVGSLGGIRTEETIICLADETAKRATDKEAHSLTKKMKKGEVFIDAFNSMTFSTASLRTEIIDYCSEKHNYYSGKDIGDCQRIKWLRGYQEPCTEGELAEQKEIVKRYNRAGIY